MKIDIIIKPEGMKAVKQVITLPNIIDIERLKYIAKTAVFEPDDNRKIYDLLNDMVKDCFWMVFAQWLEEEN